MTEKLTRPQWEALKTIQANDAEGKPTRTTKNSRHNLIGGQVAAALERKGLVRVVNVLHHPEVKITFEGHQAAKQPAPPNRWDHKPLKLGSEQKNLLLAMVSILPGSDTDSVRWPGGGWTWGSASHTRRLLQGLERRGYVHRVDGIYKLTDAGRRHARKLKEGMS